ncbi:MAG: hypothetical protein FWF08_01790, partial [Oscillospiraceae bacterium]|nr:hypothetical protein [Oscillospiraceae bacterium]
MKRSLICICSMALAALICGMAAVPALAAGENPQGPAKGNVLYDIGDSVLRGLANMLCLFMPSRHIPSEYGGSPDFYPGMGEFIDGPQGDGWKLGYARASIIPDGLFDPETGEYTGGNDIYVGGGPFGKDQRLFIDRKIPIRLLDDLCVRVTALDDGSGRGTVVLASIDSYALTSYDVRGIRALLRQFAVDNNVVSIDIGVLHQHSAIDTFGLNGPMLGGLFVNPWANLLGLSPPYTGKNQAYMEHLYTTVSNAIKEAVGNLEEGKLYYGTADASAFMHDKRPPEVLDPNLHRLRFVPDAPGGKETWLVNYSAHCTTLGANDRIVSGDYPYFMEEAVNAAGANFQMIQGAQLAVGYDGTPVAAEGKGAYDVTRDYGHALGRLLAGIGAGDAALPALLNVRHAEFRIPLDNPLHLLLCRTGMVRFESVRRHRLGAAMDLITETGYMELGNRLAVVFAPGEMEPALAFGGGLSAAEACTGKEFAFTPIKDMVRDDRELLVFGIMNDRPGYILLP